MQQRAQRRNLYPAAALTAGTVTTQTEKLTVGHGLRVYVYISAVTAGGGTDSISLVAIPPNGAAGVVMGGFSKANMLAVAGTLVFDFFPATSATGFAGSGLTFTAGVNYGATPICPPMQWAIQIVIGTANAATITIDAEILP